MLLIKNDKPNKISIYIFLFVYAISLMLLCSGLSPIIMQYFGDDAHYVYMGRVMQAGYLPYLDYFEEANKGIYIYFINFIGCCITPTSTIGNILVESISKFVDAILLFDIFYLYSTNLKKSLLSTLAAFMVMFYGPIFGCGNQCEQYVFTAFLISMFLLLKYNKRCIDKHEMAHPAKYMFIHGIMFAYVFLIKMNYTLPFVPIAIIIVINEFINKRYINGGINIIFGLIGIIIGLAPGITFLAYNNILQLAYEATFLHTKNMYGAPITIKYILMFIFRWKSLLWLFPAIAISFIILFKNKNIDYIIKAIYFIMFLFSFIACILTGQLHPIYYYHFCMYLLPLAYYVVGYILDYVDKLNMNWHFVIPVVFVFTILLNMNLLFFSFRNKPGYLGMEMLKSFKSTCEDRIHNNSFKMYSRYPQFYVMMNKVGVHVNNKYDPIANTVSTNLFESVTSLENDILVLFDSQVESLNLTNTLESYYDICGSDEYWMTKLYIRKDNR